MNPYMQSPVCYWNRCSTNIEQLPIKTGPGLSNINHHVLHCYKTEVAARAGCIEHHFRFQWIEYRVNQGRVCPVVTHSSYVGNRDTMIVGHIACGDCLDS